MQCSAVAREQIGACAHFHDLPEVQFDVAIGQMKIAVVVCDDEHRLAFRL